MNISTPHTKDVHKDNAKINYDNIYDINRLGLDEVNEGGLSITYGYEYTKADRANFNQKIKFGFANNLRFQENKDLPGNTNLGDKTSDFVGLIEYNPFDNMKIDYDFSLKNNLVDECLKKVIQTIQENTNIDKSFLEKNFLKVSWILSKSSKEKISK